jgi:hypothetical protein
MRKPGDKNEMFVTRREDKRYSVLRPGAGRASAVTDTQRQAIDRAKQIAPDAAVHIQRVRSNSPGPDKFRKE